MAEQLAPHEGTLIFKKGNSHRGEYAVSVRHEKRITFYSKPYTPLELPEGEEALFQMKDGSKVTVLKVESCNTNPLHHHLHTKEDLTPDA